MSDFEHLVSSMTCKLPGDVMIDILSRLPVKSLVRYKFVSKPWHALVESREFSCMHKLDRSNASSGYIVIYPNESTNVTEMYLVDPTTNVASNIGAPYEGLLKPVGSCNGILCLTHYKDGEVGNSFVLCNPAIRDYKEVSTFNYHRDKVVGEEEWESPHVSFAFGFDPSANDYKIVRIAQYWNLGGHPHPTKCDVYSKNNDSWRRIEASFDSMIQTNVEEIRGEMKSTGALHWTAMRDRNSLFLISFDIINETLSEIKMPTFMHSRENIPENDFKMYSYLGLQTLIDGFLEVVHYYTGDGSKKTCFIVMDMENESWVNQRKFFLTGGFYHMLALRNDGRHFMYYNSQGMYMFDLTNGSDQIVGVPEVYKRTNVYNYKESLITVNGSTKRLRFGDRRHHHHRLMSRIFHGLVGWMKKNIFLSLFVIWFMFIFFISLIISYQFESYFVLV